MYALLVRRRGIGAMDPRDLVYANFGVVDDRELCDKSITMIYSVTVECVFSRRRVLML